MIIGINVKLSRVHLIPLTQFLPLRNLTSNYSEDGRGMFFIARIDVNKTNSNRLTEVERGRRSQHRTSSLLIVWLVTTTTTTHVNVTLISKHTRRTRLSNVENDLGIDVHNRRTCWYGQRTILLQCILSVNSSNTLWTSQNRLQEHRLLHLGARCSLLVANATDPTACWAACLLAWAAMVCLGQGAACSAWL